MDGQVVDVAKLHPSNFISSAMTYSSTPCDLDDHLSVVIEIPQVHLILDLYISLSSQQD